MGVLPIFAEMIRRITALILILIVLTANFTKLFIYAGFDLNQKYIASVLCENRDKPLMNCNGKCYLMKKIQQAEEKEKSQERQSQKTRFQEALVTVNMELTIPFKLLDAVSPIELPFDLPQHPSVIFQPPQA